MQTFVKENTKEVLFIFCDAFLLFFISGNSLISAIAVLLCVVLSFYLTNLLYKNRQKKEKTVASFSFLSSLLECLQEGKSMKEAFTLSEHYISGYLEPITYDDFVESDGASLPCQDYSSFLNYVLSKDKKGEVHLANYFQVIQSLDDQIHSLQNEVLSSEKESAEAMLKVILVTLTLSLLSVLIPEIQDSFTTMDQIIIALSSGMMLPSVLFIRLVNLQEADHVQD